MPAKLLWGKAAFPGSNAWAVGNLQRLVKIGRKSRPLGVSRAFNRSFLPNCHSTFNPAPKAENLIGNQVIPQLSALSLLAVNSKGNRIKDVITKFLVWSFTVLTENEVSRSWNRLFGNKQFTDEAFDQAELLLEQLRPESPLRHRLTNELDELRSIQSRRPAAATA